MARPGGTAAAAGGNLHSACVSRLSNLRKRIRSLPTICLAYNVCVEGRH